METFSKGTIAMKKIVLLGALKRALRFEWYFSRQFDRLDRFLSGIALSALDPDHWTKLTSHIYSARGDYQRDGLFSWEKKWFDKDLPPAPCRILIGGAGTGREVIALMDLGYEVVAFDPASSFVKKTQDLQQKRACLAFEQGTYKDMADESSETAARLNTTIQSHAPYDAVVFGWGSYTHIASETVRIDVLKKCLHLAPGAPVLLSFWMRGDDTERARTRAWKAGWRLGQLFVGQKNPRAEDPGDDISGRAGYGHFFSRREIERIAKEAGYKIARQAPGPYSGVFPHTTLIPESGS